MSRVNWLLTIGWSNRCQKQFLFFFMICKAFGNPFWMKAVSRKKKIKKSLLYSTEVLNSQETTDKVLHIS